MEDDFGTDSEQFFIRSSAPPETVSGRPMSSTSGHGQYFPDQSQKAVRSGPTGTASMHDGTSVTLSAKDKSTGMISARENEIRQAHAADAAWTDADRSTLAVPCELSTKGGDHGWVTTCKAHGFSRFHRFDNAAEQMVRCDLGLKWAFLVHVMEGEEMPELMDLTGVYSELRGWAQNIAYNNSDSAEPVVIHRYLLDGSCQRDLTFANRDLGDNKVEVYLGAADPKDYADPASWPEPSTYAEDGTTYLRFTFELD